MKGDLKASVALCVAGVAVLVPLVSALGSPVFSLYLRLFLTALWLVAVVRPHIALVALAGVVPFGSVLLEALDVAPVRFTEAIVIAVMSGALVAAARSRFTNLEPQRPTMAAPALLFCTIVICSVSVGLAVTQVGTRTLWPFLRGFGSFLTWDYLVSPSSEFPHVTDGAWLIEGITLLFLVAHHSRAGLMRPVHVLQALVTGGVAAAALAIGRQLGNAYAASPSVTDMIVFVVKNRTSAHVSDVNAAGSYFAMTGVVALAMTLWRAQRVTEAGSRWRQVHRMWIGASALLFVGLWVSGSRTAVLAYVGIIVLTALTTGPFKPRWSWWRAMVVGLLAAIAIAALVVALDPRPEGSRTIVNVVRSRAAFLETSLRMIATAPWFGVGIGRYYQMSGQFMPQSIYWFVFHENAHNNFLQIAAELGVIGLAAFLWLLSAAARRLAAGVKANPDDRLMIGSAAALTAFIATWLTSHPLLVPEVAYPFWILFGTTVARADGVRQPPTVQGPGAIAWLPLVSPRTLRVMTAFGIVVLITSVMPRARREAANLDLAKTSFGFYDWEGVGERFRWSSRQATFFVSGTARELRLPLRTLHLGRNTTPTSVSIAIGGRTLHRVVLPDYQWTTVHLLLPRGASSDKFHRIDVIASPAWSLAGAMGGRTDVRILGVEVGEPTTQ